MSAMEIYRQTTPTLSTELCWRQEKCSVRIRRWKCERAAGRVCPAWNVPIQAKTRLERVPHRTLLISCCASAQEDHNELQSFSTEEFPWSMRHVRGGVLCWRSSYVCWRQFPSVASGFRSRRFRASSSWISKLRHACDRNFSSKALPPPGVTPLASVCLTVLSNSFQHN